MSERADRGDETRKMAVMNAWLDDVCAAFQIDREVMAELTPDLLRLAGTVAHGPSRPGTPLTAFAVGLASGWEAGRAGVEGDAVVADVRQRIAAVTALADERSAGADS